YRRMHVYSNSSSGRSGRAARQVSLLQNEPDTAQAVRTACSLPDPGVLIGHDGGGVIRAALYPNHPLTVRRIGPRRHVLPIHIEAKAVPARNDGEAVRRRRAKGAGTACSLEYDLRTIFALTARRHAYLQIKFAPGKEGERIIFAAGVAGISP